MRRALVGALVAASVLAGSAAAPVQAGPRSGRAFRYRKLEDEKSGASIPFPADLEDLASATSFEDLEPVLGEDFDPALIDQIAVTARGATVAWPTLLSEVGVPGATRDIVIFREGVADRVRASDAGGDNDQPSLDQDLFGLRMAFRGSDGARGDTPGNIYLRTHTRKDREAPAEGEEPASGPSEDVATEKVTSLVATTTDANFGTAYDPDLCARTRKRDAGSGVKVLERDARIAFVSTGDLHRPRTPADSDVVPDGHNPDHLPQLFLWREQTNDFFQITRIEEEGFEVNRPSISLAATRIAFECTADLTPAAVDPKDPTRTGNPDGVRQIYLWQQGRGIRQLTWSDRDCLAPRIADSGRFVLFCSQGDLITGGNPEGNFEVFAWVDGRDAARSLRQLTATAEGHSVLPRPTRSPSVFVFWSSATPAEEDAEFGAGDAQIGALPYLWRRGKVTRLGGYTDQENVDRILDSPDPESPEAPVISGPPCASADASKVQFATNDPRFNAKGANDDLDGQIGGKDADGNEIPDDRDVDASLIFFHLIRATSHARR